MQIERLAGLFLGLEFEREAPGNGYQQHGGRHHDRLEYCHKVRIGICRRSLEEQISRAFYPPGGCLSAGRLRSFGFPRDLSCGMIREPLEGWAPQSAGRRPLLVLDNCDQRGSHPCDPRRHLLMGLKW